MIKVEQHKFNPVIKSMTQKMKRIASENCGPIKTSIMPVYSRQAVLRGVVRSITRRSLIMFDATYEEWGMAPPR